MAKLNLQMNKHINNYKKLCDLVSGWTMNESNFNGIYNNILAFCCILFDTRIFDYVCPFICNFDLTNINQYLKTFMTLPDYTPNSITNAIDCVVNDISIDFICSGVVIRVVIPENQPKIDDQVYRQKATFKNVVEQINQFMIYFEDKYTQLFKHSAFDLPTTIQNIHNKMYLEEDMKLFEECNLMSLGQQMKTTWHRKNHSKSLNNLWYLQRIKKQGYTRDPFPLKKDGTKSKIRIETKLHTRLTILGIPHKPHKPLYFKGDYEINAYRCDRKYPSFKHSHEAMNPTWFKLFLDEYSRKGDFKDVEYINLQNVHLIFGENKSAKVELEDEDEDEDENSENDNENDNDNDNDREKDTENKDKNDDDNDNENDGESEDENDNDRENDTENKDGNDDDNDNENDGESEDENDNDRENDTENKDGNDDDNDNENDGGNSDANEDDNEDVNVEDDSENDDTNEDNHNDDANVDENEKPKSVKEKSSSQAQNESYDSDQSDQSNQSDQSEQSHHSNSDNSNSDEDDDRESFKKSSSKSDSDDESDDSDSDSEEEDSDIQIIGSSSPAKSEREKTNENESESEEDENDSDSQQESDENQSDKKSNDDESPSPPAPPPNLPPPPPPPQNWNQSHKNDNNKNNKDKGRNNKNDNKNHKANKHKKHGYAKDNQNEETKSPNTIVVISDSSESDSNDSKTMENNNQNKRKRSHAKSMQPNQKQSDANIQRLLNHVKFNKQDLSTLSNRTLMQTYKSMNLLDINRWGATYNDQIMLLISKMKNIEFRMVNGDLANIKIIDQKFVASLGEWTHKNKDSQQVSISRSQNIAGRNGLAFVMKLVENLLKNQVHVRKLNENSISKKQIEWFYRNLIWDNLSKAKNVLFQRPPLGHNNWLFKFYDEMEEVYEKVKGTSWNNNAGRQWFTNKYLPTMQQLYYNFLETNSLNDAVYKTITSNSWRRNAIIFNDLLSTYLQDFMNQCLKQADLDADLCIDYAKDWHEKSQLDAEFPKDKKMAQLILRAYKITNLLVYGNFITWGLGWWSGWLCLWTKQLSEYEILAVWKERNKEMWKKWVNMHMQRDQNASGIWQMTDMGKLLFLLQESDFAQEKDTDNCVWYWRRAYENIFANPNETPRQPHEEPPQKRQKISMSPPDRMYCESPRSAL